MNKLAKWGVKLTSCLCINPELILLIYCESFVGFAACEWSRAQQSLWFAKDTLTGPCSTRISELVLAQCCLDYLPLLLGWHGAVLSDGFGRMGWLCGKIEDNFGNQALRLGVLCLRTPFFSLLLGF